MFNNKKGQISVFMYMILMTVIWILMTPFLNDVISWVAPTMGTATLFFVRLVAWFVLLLLVFSASKMGKNILAIGG